jgi:hypothetical protein
VRTRCGAEGQSLDAFVEALRDGGTHGAIRANRDSQPGGIFVD